MSFIQKRCIKPPALLTPRPFPSSVELFAGTFDLPSERQDAAFRSPAHRTFQRKNEGARAKVEDKRCVGGATQPKENLITEIKRQAMQGGAVENGEQKFAKR